MKSIIAVSVAATTVGVHILLPPTITLAFTPSSLSAFHAHNAHIHRLHQRRRLSSSPATTKQFASPETNEASTSSWNIGTPSRQVIEVSKKKQLAKAALTKLLDRQQRDVQQTMELLHSLELEYDSFEKGQWIDGYNNSSLEEDETKGDVVGDEGMYRTVFNIATSSSPSTPLPSITNGANSTSISTSITASVAAGVDYGYISRSEGCRFEIMKSAGEDARFIEYGPPGNIFQLSSQQFMRNLRAMIGEYTEETDSTLTERQQFLQSKLHELTLDPIFS